MIRLGGKNGMCSSWVFRIFVILVLILSAVVNIACIECEDELIPDVSGNEGTDEFSEIEGNTNVGSSVMTVGVPVIMVLALVAVGFAVSRKSAENKNLSRQQKRAQAKSNEKKQKKKNR